jgi:hypothetical protein
MSIQDLLQKDLKQVSGPNIRLLISTLPSEYSVEVIFNCFFLLNYFYFLLEIYRSIKNNE